MSPPARRSEPAPTLRPDVRIDGRYRLQGERADRSGAQLWLALDEVLNRPVAVKVVPLETPAAPPAERVFDAVHRASQVADARLVRLLDVGRARTAGGEVVYVVSEWLDAPTLTALLREGPLSPPEATDLAHQVADLLAGVGTPHGALHPGNVFVPPTGAVRLSDLLVAAAVRGHTPDPADDLAGLGGLLYAGLTATWPLEPGPGLPPAARTGRGTPREPRQLHAGVPRELSVLTMRLLTPDERPTVRVDSPARVARLLAGLPRRPPGTAPPTSSPEPGPWTRARPWLVRTIAAATVAVIGVAGWSVGVDLGRVAGTHHLPTLPTPSTGPSTGTPLDLVGHVHDFDPEGDGTEDPDGVGLAVDNDPSTAWETDHYRGSAQFGGLKHGVGLVVDLGRPRTVREVRLALTNPGADLELRVADSAPRTIDDTRVVAVATDAPQTVALHPTAGTTARYWVLWLTKLPSIGSGRYAEGVAEMAFLT